MITTRSRDHDMLNNPTISEIGLGFAGEDLDDCDRLPGLIHGFHTKTYMDCVVT